MKKGVLLNANISMAVAQMGHTDALVIADAGLPIPESGWRIDMALTHGVPSFMQVVESVGAELCVERAVLAEEIKTHNPAVHGEFLHYIQTLGETQGKAIALEYVSHEAFKALTHGATAVVRSGECSPYANVIFYAGVVF